MRLLMRRARLPRLYPLKSNPRESRRNSSRSSSAGSTSVSVASATGVDPLAVGAAQVGDCLANQAGAPVGVARLALVAAGPVCMAAVGHPPAEPGGKVGTFLEGDDGPPEGGLQRLALFGEQALGGLGVADAAPEPEQVALRLLPERAPALGARELGRIAVLGRGGGLGG